MDILGKFGLFASVACSSAPMSTPVPTHTPVPTSGYVEGEAIGLVQDYLSNIITPYVQVSCFQYHTKSWEFAGTQTTGGDWLVEASVEETRGKDRTVVVGQWRVYKNSGIVRSVGAIDYCT